MNHAVIRSHITLLIDILGKPRPPIHPGELVLLCVQKRYPEMFEAIKKDLGLTSELLVTFVEGSTIDNKGMRITIPQKMWKTMYGKTYGESAIEVRVANEFLLQPSPGLIAFAMAHELCHLLLAIKEPRLFKRELAVDISAMLLGYRGSAFEFVNYHLMEPDGSVRFVPNGYLTPKERKYALKLLGET